MQNHITKGEQSDRPLIFSNQRRIQETQVSVVKGSYSISLSFPVFVPDSRGRREGERKRKRKTLDYLERDKEGMRNIIIYIPFVFRRGNKVPLDGFHLTETSKRKFLGLVRWLSHYEHWVLFQKAQVPSPAPTGQLTQLQFWRIYVLFFYLQATVFLWFINIHAGQIINHLLHIRYKQTKMKEENPQYFSAFKVGFQWEL